MSGKQPTQWQEVYVAYTETEADMAAERLQGFGIKTVVKHETPIVGALGVQIGTLGKASVLVEARNVERALEILAPP
jgi:Putative prokaryotic signal transducing protein